MWLEQVLDGHMKMAAAVGEEHARRDSLFGVYTASTLKHLPSEAFTWQKYS